jgi:RNA polymerase primary sigma factor
MAHPASSVDWILKQSHRYPLLTAEEEITLARQVQAWLALREIKRPTPKQRGIIRKGMRARERFYLSNIRLAVNCAGKYAGYAGTMTLEDLIQEGLMGLDSAIYKFDPTLGYKFSTYSYWWIRQGITRAINKYSRVIHLPTAANDSIRKASDYMRDYCREHGKLPPVAEVAEFCKVGTQTLLAYLNHNAGIVSLDQLMPNSHHPSTYLETVADQSDHGPSVNEIEVLADLVLAAVSSLPDQHQHIVKERYLNGAKRPTTYLVLGQELHMSRETVRQIHDHALNSLRFKLGGLTGQECIQALQSAA